MSDNSPSKKSDNSQNEKKAEIVELEQELLAANPRIFDGIDIDKRQEILQSISYTLIQEKSHSGPLPDPESIVQYNSVIPNGADRIMKMAEKQQEHRINLENKVVNSQSSQSSLGQWFGLFIGLFAIGCGTFLAYNGKTTVGSILVGSTVIGLVSVFVIGRSRQSKSE